MPEYSYHACARESLLERNLKLEVRPGSGSTHPRSGDQRVIIESVRALHISKKLSAERDDSHAAASLALSASLNSHRFGRTRASNASLGGSRTRNGHWFDN